MRRTIGAMLSLTFGNEPEVRRAAAQINALHARAHGRLPGAFLYPVAEESERIILPGTQAGAAERAVQAAQGALAPCLRGAACQLGALGLTEQQAAAATEQAQDAGAIGDVYGRCCLEEKEQPFYSPTLQERAWTSPVWYRPPGSTRAQAE